jgi:predicted GNAT family N-acyltransferase
VRVAVLARPDPGAPDAALAACFEIRTRVFVDGQGVSLDEEIDGLDGACVHFLARAGDEPVGTARLRTVEGAAKAERVAVLDTHQGRGIGRVLMDALESEARRRGLRRVVLHAQVRVIPFYERLGYEAFGPVFEEADIAHRKMEKPLEPASDGPD